MANLFHGARLKIERANQHINDLYRQSREFSKTRPYSISVENNPETGDSFLKISTDEPVPERVLLVVGDAIHNLRSSLDFVMSDIEFETTGARDPHTHFPIRPTRNDLVVAVNGGLKKKAPKAVIDFIVDAIKPYKGAVGEPLWSLHALDIEDKHRLLIAKKDVTHIRTIHCKDGSGEDFTVTEWAMIHPSVSVYPCVGRKNVQVTDKGNASIGIVFGNGMPFYGKAILPTLRDLSHFVSGTINSIERVFVASKQT
ncbi:MAG: hypothetical protein ACLPLZ_05555 [Terracidiphilus sp.]